MRGASLRLKINAAILLAFLAAAGAFGGVLHLYVSDRQAAVQNRTRTLLAVIAAHRLEALVPLLHAGHGADAAQNILDRLARVEGVTEASLFTAAGDLIAAAGPVAPVPLAQDGDGRLPSGRVFTVSAGEDRLTAVLIEPIRTEDRDLGFLRLRYALADASPLAGQVWTIFALAVAGAYIFLAGLLNLLLHRFVIDPVNTLRRAMEAVEAGDLDQNVPVTTVDALGRVGAAFNAMVTRLRETSRWLGESRAEVEEHRLLLARRVEARTAELAAANARLVEEIEARGRAEDSLSRHLALYMAILEATAEAVVCVSATLPDCEILAVNKRFLELWDLPPDWAGGKDPFQRFAPILDQIVGADEVRSRFHQLMADTEILAETCLELHDGRYIERRSGPIRQGEAYIGRVFSYVDITKRRRSEKTLRQALAQRDAVLGNTQIGLATTNSDVCTEINTRGAEILGYNREELLGRPVDILFRDMPQFQVLSSEFDQSLLTQGFVSRECQVRRQDGELIWLRVHGKVVASDAAPCDEVWAFDDITQEKQRQVSLEQAKAQAEEASRAKGAFLAVMSHEIRTPLNAVMGLTDALLAGDASPEQLGHLRTIRESAAHLLGVVNDILDFSKIEAGKLVLERIDFDVREVVGEAARTMELAARQKGLTFTVAIDPAVPAALRGDARRLRQILLNLLGNAVKFTAAGSVSLAVGPVPAGQTPPGRTGLAVTVADTGIGIDPGRSAELFDSFNQGPGSIARRFGGTGLGLAISKELVERMGGRIAVTSREGTGSTFSFTVFLAPGNADAVVRRGTAAADAAADSPPLCILLVEDNALNAAVTRLHMGRMGHSLTVAASAREAYAQLAQARFDAVLMDIEMPEIDGITATRTIRAGGPSNAPVLDPGVPIIAVTAHAVEDVRQQCLDSGMDGFVTKPVNYRTLQYTLEAISRGSCPPPSNHSQVPRDPDLFAPEQAREAMGISWPQFRSLLGVSFDEGGRRLAEARAAVATGDKARAALAAHTFKGTAAAIGAFTCRQTAISLEDALRRDDAAEAAVLLGRLHTMWDQVRVALEAWRCPDAS